MSNSDGRTARNGVPARLWRFLWRPSTTLSLGALLIVGAAGGLILWGGFNVFIEYASTEEFCISCHEMRDHSYADLQRTAHFVNATGTRATCVDCHVPREFVPKIIAKTLAIKDLVFHVTGKIDTDEKYEAHRLEMALTVWNQLKGNDSRECRNCHQNVWTETGAEFRRAAVAHTAALESGNVTCIDCHQGIAHTLPPEFIWRSEDARLADPDGWLDAMREAAAAD